MRKLLGYIDARDAHCYAGIALIAVGLWQVYQPAAFIVSGAILVYIALRRPPNGYSVDD